MKAILLPACAQALLTLAVWLWMYVTRLTAIKKSRVAIQDLADSEKEARVLKKVVNPSDNLENLFELPVLFFAIIIILFSAQIADEVYIGMAWAFVAFRVIHSLIHCTTNKIILRFSAYLVSSLILWAMWIRLTVELMH